MLTLIFLFLLLNIPLLVSSFIHPRCFWRIKLNKDKDGDLPAGCTFFFSLGQWAEKKDYFDNMLDILTPDTNYQFALPLAFSINEVNKNPDILPNMSLVLASALGVCKNVLQLQSTLDASVQMYEYLPNYVCNEIQCILILTGPYWATSAMTWRIMDLFQYQQVIQFTFGPFHPVLSDHELFPYLFQMAPQDTSLAKAMISLMLHFNWNWIGLVILDNDQGTQFISNLRTEMESNTICFAFISMIPVNTNFYMSRAEVYYNEIMTSSTNIVIIYGEIDSTLAVSFRMWNSLSLQRIWLTTSQWDDSTSNKIFTLDSSIGNLVFAPHHAEISGFKNFVHTLTHLKYSDYCLENLQWMKFNCEVSASKWKMLKNFSSNACLEWLEVQTFDMAFSDDSYDIYNAVYALAHGLHEMLFQQEYNHPVNNRKKSEINCLKLHSFLRKTHFTNPFGEKVIMNQKEKLMSDYDIFQTWNFLHGLVLKVKIGFFSPYFPHGQQLHLSEDVIGWPIGSQKRTPQINVPGISGSTFDAFLFWRKGRWWVGWGERRGGRGRGRQDGDMSLMPPSVCSADCGPGFRKFAQEGIAACCFDCRPCPENEISNETNVHQCVKCPEHQYANTEQNRCIDKAVIFMTYEDPFGLALALMALGFSAFTAVILWIFVKYHDTPIVKANNRNLSYTLLITLIFCFLCPLLFIGHPNSVTCILQQISFGVLFTVAISTVLAKTLTVLLAFTVIAPGIKMRYLLLTKVPNFIIVVCTIIQIIFCAIWLGVSPPFIDIDAHFDHCHIIIVCNKGSVIAFYCVLGYHGSLALVSFVVAFLARNLPDTFNEAKFLTFSMILFCSVWITFLPVYHSTKGKVMLSVEVLSILASSAGLLGCIFFPKCYIILLRPERNSLQMLKEKSFS